VNVRHLQSWIVWLVAAGVLVALLWPMIVAPTSHVPMRPLDVYEVSTLNDFGVYYYPMADVTFEMWREGEVPLWNPYVYSGMPLLASIETAAFYPPNVPRLFVSTERAFTLLHVFHVLLAALGTWLYCRGRGISTAGSLLAAMVFAAAGPGVLRLLAGHITIIHSAAWWPLILWLVDRCIRRPTIGRGCWLALALGTQFLAGFPMYTYAMALLIPAYLLVFAVRWEHPLQRRTFKLLGILFGAAVLAVGLVAVQLLPTAEFMGGSHRGDLDYEQATICSFPLINLVTAIVPDFYGDDVTCGYWGEWYLWEGSLYCGVVALVLAALTLPLWHRPEVAFWLISGVVVMAIALGKYSAVYDACYFLLPGLNLFRGIGKLCIFPVFGLAVLAGTGLDLLTVSLVPPRRVIAVVAITAGVLGIGGFLLAMPGLSAEAEAPHWWGSFVSWVEARHEIVRATIIDNLPYWTIPAVVDEFVSEAERNAFLGSSYRCMCRSLELSACMLMISAVTLGLTLWKRSLRPTAAVLLVGLCGAELFLFGHRYWVTTDSAQLKSIGQDVLAKVDDDSAPWRFGVISPRIMWPMNQFMYARIEGVGGHENSVLDRYSYFVNEVRGSDDKKNVTLSLPYHPVLYDLMNIRYYASGAENRAHDPLVGKNVFRYGGRDYHLYENPDVLDRVLILHRVEVVDSMEEAGKRIPTLLSDGPLLSTVIEGKPRFTPQAVTPEQLSAEQIKFVERSPNRIVVDARLSQPGILLFSEVFAEGWTATVDGEPVEIHPANVFMRAVSLDAGEHRVEMVYRPDSFVLGSCLTLGFLAITALGIIVPAAFGRRKRSKGIRPRDEHPPEQESHGEAVRDSRSDQDGESRFDTDDGIENDSDRTSATQPRRRGAAICLIVAVVLLVGSTAARTLWEFQRCQVERVAIGHQNVGLIYATRGQLDVAIRHIRRGIEVTPNNAVMHNNLGAVYASARQFDKAEYHYKRALQIKPDFIQPRKNLQALQVMRFR
jgi:hypothetical protein